MMEIESIRQAIEGHRPKRLSATAHDHAAVALILDASRSAADPSVVFIERSRHPEDPWAGHMAFPGGRRDPQDRSLQHVARRETVEEIGIRLTPGQCVGRLDDLRGRHSGRTLRMVISCFVFTVDDFGTLRMNSEVQDVVRVPLSRLTDHKNLVQVSASGTEKRLHPGIQVSACGEKVVWGLTYRFLSGFLNLLGHKLPDG
jgi:8-oxo-dGTP pyrophosphatase MutT (NUDIX family)